MYENYPKQKSNKAIEFLKKRKLKNINWPPYSPDLNLIENVRRTMARKIK